MKTLYSEGPPFRNGAIFQGALTPEDWLTPTYCNHDKANQQGVGDFGPKLRGVPLGADPSCWGCEERTSQTN